MRAAVLYEPGQGLQIDDVELDEPKSGEVLVKIVATGACHSDLHLILGERRYALPMVLGHEAAGIVERLGPGVTSLQPGDHVILNFQPACGRCRYCIVGQPQVCSVRGRIPGTLLDGTTRLHKNGRPIYHMACTASFAEYAVVPEQGAVPIPKDFPLDRAALIGCCVMTGVGAVLNTAKVPAGATVAVFGCGGVGLNVVQGAKLAAAAKIIAVDIRPKRLDAAAMMGATHLIDASREDPVARIHELTDEGVDFAFEVITTPETVRQAFDATARRGTVIIVGLARQDAEVSLPIGPFFQERSVMGSSYGSARPAVDFPMIIDQYRKGNLKLDELITGRCSLEEINTAFEALRRGEGIRTVIQFD